MTALLNSSTTLINGLRPTELERRVGRLLRSPEGHDAGGADGGAAPAAADAGASGDAGNDAGGDGADAGNAGAGSDDSTVLGSAKADDGAGDDTKADSKAPPTATPVPDDSGVPETYELKPFTVGEGDEATTIEIDPTLLETVTPGLKEAGVKQEQLEKLAPLVPAIQEAVVKNMNDKFAETRADWAKQAQADPEIGGKNWTETQRLAAKALDTFGAKSEIVDGKETNEFRALLNDSGLGNHPALIRMFRAIGAAASEDGNFTRNTSAVEQPKSREEKLYPNDVPAKS